MRLPTRALGLSLIELLAVLVLASAFSYVSARLFDSSIRITRQARDVPRRDALRDGVLERLRSDVWGAAEFAVADDRTLVLRYFGDRSVFWRVEGDGTVSRNELFHTERERFDRWTPAVAPRRFEKSGPALRVVWPRGPGDRRAEIDMYSQIILMGERRDD